MNPIHGESRGSVEYEAWKKIRGRCLNPTNAKYPIYGGRGITICERWGKYENFLADMGRRPIGKTSIDRIDNDGNYEPSNCRWADASQQVRNRSNTIHLRIGEVTKTLTEWALLTGVKYHTAKRRLYRGFSPAAAVGLDIAELYV